MKTRKTEDNAIDLPNADDLNDYFVSIGPKMPAKFNDEKSRYSIRNNDIGSYFIKQLNQRLQKI